MRDRRREAAAATQNAAFTAWLQGAGGSMTWGAFCRRYGLLDVEKEVSAESEAKLPAAKTDSGIYDWAEKIAAPYKKM